MSITLSQPFSEYSSIGSPQEAPALFTRMSKLPSSSFILETKAAIPSKFDKSAGIEMQLPSYSLLNLSAVASHVSALRELI